MRIVMTTTGPIMGEKSGIQKITVFRGIPYAAAPVGDLRWRAPQPHAPWQEVRDCTRFGPASIQTEHPVGSFYEKEFYQGGVDMSEDCLYLNIWADLSREKQPVLFWIHGGAYMHGFSNEMEFDGDAIAKRGAILVSVNYRVGVLGFLAHPELTARDGHSGNYGLMDQIFALKWVRENIAAFGGDPENITIFGQSAGGGSVQSLMTSPLAKGLFRRAIIQSAGSPLKTLSGGMTQKMAEENGLAVEKIAGCTLEGLQKMDPMELLRIGREVLAQSGGLRFRPCVDGYVLQEDPGVVFARGDAADESLMMGTVTGDANTFGLKGGDADQMAAAATVAMAKARLRLGKGGAYVYHFCREIPGDDHPGAFHSSELWYVFGTLMRSNRPFTGLDYELSLQMTDWWVNFARTGDPGAGWTAYTEESPQINMIDKRGTMRSIRCLPQADAESDAMIERIYG